MLTRAASRFARAIACSSCRSSRSSTYTAGWNGTTLEERVEYSLKTTGFSFDPERAARLIRGLAKGLDEIHAVGVVHRDLSPGNVLCCGSGETELFKISDFGIARPAGLSVTFGNMLVGTPGYLAPEQIVSEGDTISPSTDIFSFAAIVYFVLTGDQLFNARNAVAALMLSRAAERRSLLEAGNPASGIARARRCLPGHRSGHRARHRARSEAAPAKRSALRRQPLTLD